MKLNKYTYLSTLLLLLFTFISCERKEDVLPHPIDTLFQQIEDYKYRDLTLATTLADSACTLATQENKFKATALNYKGFCAYMHMDYEQATLLYKQAYALTNNQLVKLTSDIGLMRICQRTSMNKEFYDHRYNAMKRIERINEEKNSLSAQDLKALASALTDFQLVQATYFYYLQQEEQSIQAIRRIKPNNELKQNAPLYLYYLYLRSIIESEYLSSDDDDLLNSFDDLYQCLSSAHQLNYPYFEANASQALAELLKEPAVYKLIATEKSRHLRNLNAENLPEEELPIALVRNALHLFKDYGDMYQMASCYRALASCYNQQEEHGKALQYLTRALNYVNQHHETYYHCKDSTEILRPYIPKATRSIEIDWIKEGIKTVPEWIARIREQLSLTYAALGMKQASDYNRNIYLDMLDYTRQDKELESRYATLQQESQVLTYLLFAICMGILILIPAFIILNRLWHKHHIQYINQLKDTLELCKKITLSIPGSDSSLDDLREQIELNIHDDMVRLFHAEEFKLCDEGNQPDITHAACQQLFVLPNRNEDEPLGCLYISKQTPFSKEEISLLKVILPYLTWAMENGQTFLSLSDAQTNLEKLCYLHQRHWTENKKQNLIKKACLFLVNNLTPYIDRIIHEVEHKRISDQPEAESESFQIHYIDELITRINEYNDILALWIKVKQGTLSLNIENFALNDLFEVIQKSRKAFEMKHQTLTVDKTGAIIKADKALTLFMINTLAENARKYTPAGGEIHIHTDETDNYVEISVTDNGPGLSEEDQQLLVNNKVYDSGKIGIHPQQHNSQIAQQKGYGFGLMNCKGIIEKYKKTNSLFQVCTFQIESSLGKGSRFFFRLPKGILRTLVICLFCCIQSCQPAAETTMQTENEETADSIDTSNVLLQRANLFADKVYHCNIDGNYEQALCYADSVLHYLNQHHSIFENQSGTNAMLVDSVRPAELAWFNDGFTTDYYTLLDVRNEAAVAYLALNDVYGYRYNNDAYTTLYKQISKDNTLDAYCRKVQHSANNKIVGSILLLVLAAIFILGFYIYHLRHRLLYRYNLEQVLNVNQQAFSASIASSHQQTASSIVKAIYNEMNELFDISLLGIAIRQPEHEKVDYVFSSEDEACETMTENLALCLQREEAQWESTNSIKTVPLWIETGDKQLCIGALSFQRTFHNEHDSDLLLMELIANYIAIIIYHSMILMEQKQQDLELTQDELHRITHEENLLHVQNQVLDNCLSTIKHETLYYPNKIKLLVDKLKENPTTEEKVNHIETISELISYYKDILTILSSCASRQVEQVTFRRGILSTTEIEQHIQAYFKRKMKAMPDRLVFTTQVENMNVLCDATLCYYLIENLIDEAISHPESGELQLSIVQEDNFVRFNFTDKRRNKTEEELNNLFYPSLDKIKESNTYHGTLYLLCKQIIREHDEYAGRRGCRINAQSVAEGDGFTVWFTLPLVKKYHTT